MSKITIETEKASLVIPLMDARCDCDNCEEHLHTLIERIREGRGLVLELRPDRNVHGTLMGYHVAIAKEVEQ